MGDSPQQRREIALPVGEQLEGMELCLGTDDKPAQSLWVGISRQTNAGTAMGVCSRPPDQKGVNEAFFRQPQEASRSKALAVTGDFNRSNTCWKDKTQEVSGVHQ